MKQDILWKSINTDFYYPIANISCVTKTQLCTKGKLFQCNTMCIMTIGHLYRGIMGTKATPDINNNLVFKEPEVLEEKAFLPNAIIMSKERKTEQK